MRLFSSQIAIMAKPPTSVRKSKCGQRAWPWRPPDKFEQFWYQQHSRPSVDTELDTKLKPLQRLTRTKKKTSGPETWRCSCWWTGSLVGDIPLNYLSNTVGWLCGPGRFVKKNCLMEPHQEDCIRQSDLFWRSSLHENDQPKKSEFGP